MTPSPSPVLIQLVGQNATPVWLTPVLTGVFVLAAAVIAGLLGFRSLRESDRRKIAREADAQWNSELKASYIALREEVLKVARALASTQRVNDDGHELLETLEAAMIASSEQVSLFELIASPKVIDEARGVSLHLSNVWQRTFVSTMQDDVDLRWTAQEAMSIDGRLDGLRDTLRESLRG